MLYLCSGLLKQTKDRQKQSEDTREEINIQEQNERIRRIVAHENELRAEINKIIAELEEE